MARHQTRTGAYARWLSANQPSDGTHRLATGSWEQDRSIPRLETSAGGWCTRCVSATLTMPDYDALTRQTLTQKVPLWTHRDRRRRLGDSIYDFETDPPTQRLGVHGDGNRYTDLSGLQVLLSDHFYYFGDNPQPLPDDLLPIVRQGQ